MENEHAKREGGLVQPSVEIDPMMLSQFQTTKELAAYYGVPSRNIRERFLRQREAGKFRDGLDCFQESYGGMHGHQWRISQVIFERENEQLKHQAAANRERMSQLVETSETANTLPRSESVENETSSEGQGGQLDVLRTKVEMLREISQANKEKAAEYKALFEKASREADENKKAASNAAFYQAQLMMLKSGTGNADAISLDPKAETINQSTPVEYEQAA